jgi:hypothetical protein
MTQTHAGPKSYVCRGSNQIGGPLKDAVGWCPVCHRVRMLRVGTGRLVQHWSTYEAHA